MCICFAQLRSTFQSSIDRISFDLSTRYVRALSLVNVSERPETSEERNRGMVQGFPHVDYCYVFFPRYSCMKDMYSVKSPSLFSR